MRREGLALSALDQRSQVWAAPDVRELSLEQGQDEGSAKGLRDEDPEGDVQQDFGRERRGNKETKGGGGEEGARGEKGAQGGQGGEGEGQGQGWQKGQEEGQGRQGKEEEEEGCRVRRQPAHCHK